MLRLGCTQISAKGSPRENGLAHLGAVRPDCNLRAHEAREGAAPSKRPTARSSQRDLRKELRLGDSDFGVRCDHDLFGLANIRPSLDQRGRHSWRHFRRKWLFHQGASAWHSLRVVAEEYADGIFFLCDLPLQVRNLGICGVEDLLSLKHVKLCRHAVLDTKIGKL